MKNIQTTALNRTTLMFPLALVLFEFAVYIGNDLIQPAMLAITEDFGVSATWAPSSMSFYLLGGASVAWLLGPLSDRLGRKKVLLSGVLFFALCCFLILLTRQIEHFLTLRFLQGIGLSVISAVGYAAIQENFAERDAIKVMALMANISLLAPLLGPVLGAFLIDYVSWHWGFVAIALLALLSWVGLKMLWIALSPIILVDELKLTSVQYGLAQFPVFLGLIVGNIVLIKIIDRLALGKTVLIGLPIMLTGTLILILGVVWQAYLIPCLLIGMTLICFGEGISFSVLYRFALMSSEVSKGTVAAAVSMLLMTSFFAMIELVRYLYTQFHLWAFVLSAFAFIALWFTQPRLALKREMQERVAQDLH